MNTESENLTIPEAGATAGHPFIEASSTRPDLPPEAFPRDGFYGPRAYLLLQDNASQMSHTGTNTWILKEPGDDACVIVDPGNYQEPHMQRILQAIEDLHAKPMAILLTHCHDDHCEAADPLSQTLQVPVLSKQNGGLPVAEWDDAGRLGQDNAENIASLLMDIPIPHCRLKLQSIWLPGHSPDSTGIIVAEDHSLVSGDVLFAHGSTVLAGGTLKQYLGSLDIMEQLVETGTATRFLSAHGHVLDDPAAHIRNQRKHRMKRLERLSVTIQDRQTTNPEELLRIVYGDITPRLRRPALRNIHAQLAYLRETGHPCLEGLE